MSNELKLSVSKVKCFNDCKKRYEFAYILKFPQKDEDYHIIGKFCHLVLEYFHKAYIEGSLESLSSEMSKSWKKAISEYKNQLSDDMKKQCRGFIEEYLKIITQDKKNNLSANVIACERPFNLEIGENVSLRGVIDRVQIDDDAMVHVADYKTSKSKEPLKKDWFQLLTYCYILLLENPDIKRMRASYILLRHNYEYITKEFTVEEILDVKNKYLEYAQKMRDEKMFEPNPTFFCNWCPFLTHCEAGKNKVKPELKYGEVSY